MEPIICYGASTWVKALSYKSVQKKLLSFQRLIAIKIIRGFRTVSTAASISIAQLVPLPAKIEEIADIERSKLRGTTRFLPGDVPIESPSLPSQLLHPSLRSGITFTEITSTSDFDRVDTSGAWQAYTDGSRHADGVGSAFVLVDPDGNRIIKKFKLHPTCSVFQAELLAIERICRWILDNNIPSSFIFSDSKSGLTELRNPNTHNHFAVQIHHHLNNAIHKNIRVHFAWIKAHAGFPGNEEADAAAKSAASSHKSPAYFHTPISFIKYKNKELSTKASADLYVDPHSCKYTRSLLSSHQELIEFLTVIKPNFAVTQFLTNHGFHKSYLHRFHITDDPFCPCDNTTPQTINHLIVDCPRFQSSRLDHQFTSPSQCTDIFNLKNIIKRPSTTKSFIAHLTHIVNNLKKFNNT